MSDQEKLSIEVTAAVAPLIEALSTAKQALESFAQKINSLSGQQNLVTATKEYTDALKQQTQQADQTADAVVQSEAEKRRAAEMTRIANERAIAEEQGNTRKLLQLKKQAAEAQLEFQKRSRVAEIATPDSSIGRLEEIAILEDIAKKKLAIQEQYTRDVLALSADEKARQMSDLARAAVEEAQIAQTLASKRVQLATKTAAMIALIKEREAKAIAAGLREGGEPSDWAEQEAAIRAKAAEEIVQIELNKATELIRIKEKEQIAEQALQEKAARQSGDRVKQAELEARKLKIIATARMDVLKAEAKAKAAPGTSQLTIDAEAARKFQEETGKAFDAYIADVDKAKAASIALGQAMEYESAMHSLSQLSMAFAAVGAAITGAFTAALKPVMDLEKGLASVAAVSQKPLDSPGMKVLRNQAIDLGSQFLYTTGEIAEGMKFLAQAGFDIPQIKGMTKDILNLAAAADLPLKNAFEVAATTIRGFHMQASEMGRVSNVLAITANKTNVEVQELAESFKYAGPVAAAAGVQIEDVAAALGLMANAGIKGSMGGTALRQTISALIAPTSNQRRMIEELGLKIDQTGGKFAGFEDIVRQMGVLFKTSVTDPAAQAGLAMKLFGDRAGPGMLAVINEGVGGLQKLKQAYGDLGESSDVAATTAAARMDNLTDSLTKFTRASESLSGAVFFDLLAVLKPIVDMFTEALRAMTKFAQEHRTLANVVAGIAAIVGVLGLLLTGFGILTAVVSRFGAQLAQTGKQGMTTGALLKFAFTGAKSALLGTAAAAQTAAGGIVAVERATWRARAAALALGSVGWITLLIAAIPLVITLLEELGIVQSKNAVAAEDTAASVESTNDAFKALGASSSGLKKYGAEFEAIDKSIQRLLSRLKDMNGKDIAISWENISGTIGQITAGMDGITGKAKDLLANTSLTDAEYAKQALALMEQAEYWKEIGAEAIKLIDVQLAQSSSIANAAKAEEERATAQAYSWRLIEFQAAKYREVAAEARKTLAEEQKRIAVLNASRAKIVEVQNNKVADTVDDRKVEKAVVEGIVSTTAKLRLLAQEYKKWQEDEARLLEFATRREAVSGRGLTKEELGYRAVRRELEMYAETGTQLEAKLSDLTQKGIGFIQSLWPGLAIKDNKELLATHKALNEELERTAEGAGGGDTGAAAKTIQKIKELQAAYKEAAQIQIEVEKKKVDTLLKLQEQLHNQIKALDQKERDRKTSHAATLRGILRSATGDSSQTIIADWGSQIKALEKTLKFTFELDADTRKKTLLELEQTAAAGAQAVGSKLQSIYSSLTKSEKQYIENRGGAAADLIQKMNEVSADDKGSKGRVKAFIDLANQLEVMKKKYQDIHSIINRNDEIERQTAEQRLRYATADLEIAKAKETSLKTQVETITKAMGDPKAKELGASFTDFEPLKADWRTAEAEIIAGIEKINKTEIQPKVKIEIPKEILGQPEQIVDIKPEVQKPVGPDAVEIVKMATQTGPVKKTVEIAPEVDSDAAAKAGTEMGTTASTAQVEASKPIVTSFWRDIGTGFGTLVGTMVSSFSDLANTLVKNITSITWDEIGAAAGQALYGDFVSAFSGLSDFIKGIFDSIEVNIKVDAKVKKRLGGLIPGYGGGDIVPASLEPGEFVIRKESVSKYGSEFFSMLNHMRSPAAMSSMPKVVGTPRVAFAEGGLVQTPNTAMGTYNLNLSVGGRTFAVQGQRSAIEGLIEQLRREELTTT